MIISGRRHRAAAQTCKTQPHNPASCSYKRANRFLTGQSRCLTLQSRSLERPTRFLARQDRFLVSQDRFLERADRFLGVQNRGDKTESRRLIGESHVLMKKRPGKMRPEPLPPLALH